MESSWSHDSINGVKFLSSQKTIPLEHIYFFTSRQCQSFASQNCRLTRVFLAFGFLSLYNIKPGLFKISNDFNQCIRILI